MMFHFLIVLFNRNNKKNINIKQELIIEIIQNKSLKDIVSINLLHKLAKLAEIMTNPIALDWPIFVITIRTQNTKLIKLMF